MLNQQEQVKSREKDKLVLWLSLFIGLSVVVLLCAISVVIARNIDGWSFDGEEQYISLPSLEEDVTNNLLL